MKEIYFNTNLQQKMAKFPFSKKNRKDDRRCFILSKRL
jgi:hypothetical protein